MREESYQQAELSSIRKLNKSKVLFSCKAEMCYQIEKKKKKKHILMVVFKMIAFDLLVIRHYRVYCSVLTFLYIHMNNKINTNE